MHLTKSVCPPENRLKRRAEEISHDQMVLSQQPANTVAVVGETDDATLVAIDVRGAVAP